MKIVVIGGTGLIGSQVVARLNDHGHDARPASPQTGVDTITGEGLDQALKGVDALVDVSNSPSFADADVMDFFTTSTQHLTAGARRAGIAHYVALSVVGCDRLPDSGYLRAKVAQEQLITGSGLAHTIVRATQFYEFLPAVAQAATVEGKVHLPSAYFQPMASSDVAAVVARTSVSAPVGGIIEIGGPQRVRMDELVAAVLRAAGDPREVVTDPRATYFGTTLADDSLVPGPDALLATTTHEQWMAAAAPN